MDLYEFIESFDRGGDVIPDSHKRVDLALKIHSKVQFTEGCWLWTAALNFAGYSTLTTCRGHGLSSLVYRALYECFNGRVEEGLVLDHLCRNTRCVNPDHLEPVTPQENVFRGIVARTECVNGHPYHENRIVNGQWTRCRKCHAEREAKRYRTSA